MRLIRLSLSCMLLASVAPSLRAEYVSLRNGQQFHVTSYQLIGDKYRLQLVGGVVEVSVDEVLSIEPEDTFASVPPPPASAPVAPYKELVKAAASRYAVDEELINSVIAAESNFDPKAISKKNARGLMQLLPETAAKFGVQDIFDPKENIDAGTHYLSDLLKRYNNDLVLALAAYNAGPEKVEQFGTVPPYSETISYIRRIKKAYEKSKTTSTQGVELTVAPKATVEKAKTAAASQNAPAAPITPQASVPN